MRKTGQGFPPINRIHPAGMLLSGPRLYLGNLAGLVKV